VYRAAVFTYAYAYTFVKASDEREHIGILILYANRISLMNIAASCIALLAAAVLLWATTHI